MRRWSEGAVSRVVNMAHQTGIQASDELKSAFGNLSGGAKRLLKVGIRDEELVLVKSEGPVGSWEEVSSCLEDDKPCYILYRLDSMQGESYEWLLLAYTPDSSTVKDRMLYAATRATLKMEFGGGKVKEELFGTMKSEFTLDAYKEHLLAAEGPAPLTQQEEELRSLAEADIQAKTEIGTQTRQSHLHGVTFPIEEQALTCLMKLREKKITYVQLSIDVNDEKICLAGHKEEMSVADLPSSVPDDHPRYHLFLFKHTYEGDYLEQIVFIYSCPGYKSSVKERMLYSSCKAAVIGVAESDLQMVIVKKIEVEEGSELTADFLLDEVHPKSIVYKQQFMRPPPPRGRRRSKSPRPITDNNDQRQKSQSPSGEGNDSRDASAEPN